MLEYVRRSCAAPDLTDPITVVWTDPNNSRYSNINTEQRALLTFSGTNFGWDYTLDLDFTENENTDSWTGGIPNEAVLAPTRIPTGGILSNLINPFGPESAAGQALINSTYMNGAYQPSKDKFWNVDGHATHELGDAFNAGTPATVAVGLNFGGELDYATTPLAIPLAAATAYDQQSMGSRTTQAVFMELDVPMSSKLDVDLSARQDRYSDFGQTTNGKLQVRYQPSHFVTFRGSASTGFRAPTLSICISHRSWRLEQFGGATSGYGNPVCAAELASGNFNARSSPSRPATTRD